MKSSLIVSFVTVNLNNPVGLEKTLQGLMQLKIRLGGSKVEVILVDGCSGKQDQQVIKKYIEFIDCLIVEEDAGIYHAMNKGMAKALGRFVNFMNSGDSPNVDGMVELFETELCIDNVYYGRAVWTENRRVGIFTDCISRFFLKMPNHQAMFFPNELVKSYNYNTDYEIAADLDFKLHSMQNFKFCKFDRVVVECEPGGKSQTIKSFSILIRRAHEIRKIAKCKNGFWSSNINFTKFVVWHGLKMVL